MKRGFLVLLGIVLIFACRAHAYDDHDFQVWNTDVEEVKINKDTKAALEEEFRWGENAKEFYYHHYDIGFTRSLKKYLSVGGGYRHVLELKKGRFKIENEPYITATFFWDMAGFKFDSRNRFEYRHFAYQADSGRYRNKVTVRSPWSFTGLKIQPFMSDEVFFSFGGSNQFNQNRLSCGLGINLAKNIKGELYYMLQSSKGSKGWTDINVLGTKIKVSF